MGTTTVTTRDGSSGLFLVTGAVATAIVVVCGTAYLFRAEVAEADTLRAQAWSEAQLIRASRCDRGGSEGGGVSSRAASRDRDSLWGTGSSDHGKCILCHDSSLAEAAGGPQLNRRRVRVIDVLSSPLTARALPPGELGHIERIAMPGHRVRVGRREWEA